MVRLNTADLAAIRSHGVSEEQVRWALGRLAQGRHPVRVERAATLGDGIDVLHEDDLVHWAAARDRGVLEALVPASGAATRMFRDELTAAEVAALPLGPDPSIWAGQPKLLVPFHRAEDGTVRRPLEEHRDEAQALGCRRLHLTVSSGHIERVRALVGEAVGLSTQAQSTDLPALGADGEPVRSGGTLVLRPGGHGALLANVEATGAAVLLVKNVDNVLPEANRGPVLRSRRLLAGRLLRLQERAHALLRAGDSTGAEAFCREVLASAEEGEDALARLDRPFRVCGMVRASGAVGGGPCWVGGALRIVEGVELDAPVPGATHFNPVDMALGLRNHLGEPFVLADFVDREAVLVTRKQVAGVDAAVLEWPGLWNGSMSGWNTVFVEVPAETFAPVKSVRDLLSPLHAV